MFDFFHQHLKVFRVQVFGLLRFNPRCFILFDAMVNGIVSLISISNILLVYRSATDSHMLTLYPETFLNLLMRSSNYLVASLGFSIYVTACHIQTVAVLLLFQFGLSVFLLLLYVLWLELQKLC